MKNFRYFYSWFSFSQGFTTLGLLKNRLRLGFVFVLTVFLLSNLISGCYYYKVTTNSSVEPGVISHWADTNKIFVIHSQTGISIINNIRITHDSIIGNYVGEYKFPIKTEKFPKENSLNRYRKHKGDLRILNEVHLYNPQTQLNGNTVSLALKDIYRFDIYKPDSGTTIFSWVISIAGSIFIGIPLLIILVFTILALAGASCPFVYVNTGNGFAFAGEIYSGAIYAPLERNDYLALPQLVAVDGKYMLKIANELQEIQHTNLAELIIIDHPLNSKVLIDKYGKCQTISELRTPITAANLTGTDILKYIRNKDSISYCGMSPEKDIPLTDGVILTFNHPKDTKSGKLFIKARNSFWLDNVYGNFHGLLGSYNKFWSKKQNNADSAKLMEWTLNQKIPLSVYIEKNGKWLFCDYFNMIGPMALKEDVLSLDLKGINDSQFKIKLESGTYFWEIDYVGIDYSENIPVKLTTVKIDKAINEDNEIVTELLKYDDLSYYIQPATDNIADLTFQVPQETTAERTVILHSKGYYLTNQPTKGLPQTKKLKSIHEPGQFLEYSRELMKSEYGTLSNK